MRSRCLLDVVDAFEVERSFYGFCLAFYESI